MFCMSSSPPRQQMPPPQQSAPRQRRLQALAAGRGVPAASGRHGQSCRRCATCSFTSRSAAQPCFVRLQHFEMLRHRPYSDPACCCCNLSLPLQWSTEPYCSNAAALLALLEDLLAGIVLAPPGS